MKEIKKIDKKSLARTVAFFYSLPGLAVFICFLIISLANAFTSNSLPAPPWKVALFLVGFSIVLGMAVSLIAAVFGWIIGYLFAAIYNLTTPKMGGVKMELEEEEPENIAKLF